MSGILSAKFKIGVTYAKKKEGNFVITTLNELVVLCSYCKCYVYVLQPRNSETKPVTTPMLNKMSAAT